MAQPHTGPRSRSTLATFQRIKLWHVQHKTDHPVEYHLWDAVLTVWLMGWIAWLPAFALGDEWAYPLCVVCILTPRFYIRWRVRAHEAQRVRCDWAEQA